MKNYITGASGFIGSHLARRFGGAATCLKHGEEIPSRIDTLWHLAAYGNMAGQNDWRMIMKANVIDTVNLTAVSNRIIFVSTSSINLPVQTPYSLSKQTAEQVLASSGKTVYIARPYSVTGVGEQKEHLIPKLIRSCMEGEPMMLCHDATHDFVDVDDFVDGLASLPGAAPGIYEFGNGFPVTNAEVLSMVESITGKAANITGPFPARPYDRADWCCQNPMLGWMPKKPLRKSILEMVEAYDNTAKTLR